MAVTAEWQFELNALLLGTDTNFVVTRVEGLDMPEVEGNDLPKAIADGAFLGPARLLPRTVTLEITVVGNVPANLSSLRDAWRHNRAASDLVYRPRGFGNRRINGVPRRCKWVQGNEHFGGVEAIVEFFAGDPRIFDVAAGTEVVY